MFEKEFGVILFAKSNMNFKTCSVCNLSNIKFLNDLNSGRT